MKRGSLSAWRHFHPPPSTCTSASSAPVWPSKSGMLWKGALVHLYSLHLYKPERSSVLAALPAGEATHAAGTVACPCNALVHNPSNHGVHDPSNDAPSLYLLYSTSSAITSSCLGAFIFWWKFSTNDFSRSRITQELECASSVP